MSFKLTKLPRLETGDIDLPRVDADFHDFVGGPSFLAEDLRLEHTQQVESMRDMASTFVAMATPMIAMENAKKVVMPFLVNMFWKPLVIALVVAWVAHWLYGAATDLLIDNIEATTAADAVPADASSAAATEDPVPADDQTALTAPTDSTAESLAESSPSLSEAFEALEAAATPPALWQRLVLAVALAGVAWCVYKALHWGRIAAPTVVHAVDTAMSSRRFTAPYWNKRSRKFLKLAGYALLGHAVAFPVVVLGLVRVLGRLGRGLDVALSGYFVAFGTLGRFGLWVAFIISAFLFGVMRTAGVAGLVDMEKPVTPM